MFRLKEKKERGQVLVESAIVFPLMIFFTLGILQLTMLQQGKVMMDYAAYAAARSGVVNNGDKIPMEAAANIALLSLHSRTNDFSSFISTYAKLVLLKAVAENVKELTDKWKDSGSLLKGIGAKILDAGAAALPVGSYGSWARVFIVSPKSSDFGGFAEEIEFDYTDKTEMQFMNATTMLPGKDANILTVAVSYDFEMKIAFVNWVMFEAWYATQVAIKLSGAIWSSRLQSDTATSAVGVGNTTRKSTRDALEAGTQQGKGRVYIRARKALKYYWDKQGQNQYYIPLYGSYSMRMHSNLFFKNVEVTDNSDRSHGLPTTNAGGN